MNKIYFAIFIILMLSLIYHIYVSSYKKKDILCKSGYDPIYDIHSNCTVGDHKKAKTHKDYLDSAHSGLIRGAIVGCLLGEFALPAAVMNGAIFGIMNPVMLYIGF